MSVDDPYPMFPYEGAVAMLLPWLLAMGTKQFLGSSSALSMYKGRSKCLCSITDQVRDATWVEQNG